VSALVQVPEPLLVTVSALLAPVVFSRIPPLAPLEEMCSKVRGVPPTSVLLTLSALPDPVSITLPEPVTSRVPLEVATRPSPVVVSMLRPPPDSVRVWPSLLAIVTAVPATVLSVLVALLNVVEPPRLPRAPAPPTTMPPPASLVSLIAPLSATAPPVRPVTVAVAPEPLPRVPG
jgi:hypothetical protein